MRGHGLGFEKGIINYEIEHPNADGRASGQADPSGQSPAGAFQPLAGAVQHVGRGRGRPVRWLHGAGRGGLHQHLRHPVHRLPHRPEQRHQRAGGPLLRGQARRRRPVHGPLSAGGQLHCRCGAAGHRAAGFPRPAPAPEHQGRPAPRRHPLPAGLLPRHAGAGALQLRQRHLQRHRRHKKTAVLSEHRGRSEHPAQPLLRHRLQAGRSGRGAGQRHLPVRLGGAHPPRPDQGAGLLP